MLLSVYKFLSYVYCLFNIAYLKTGLKLIQFDNVPLQLKVPTPEKPGNFVNFRKLLLNRCQKEFEKDQDDDAIFEKKQKEMEAAKEVRCLYFIFLMLSKQVVLKFK